VLPNFETGQTYTAATATWIVPAVSFQDAPLGFAFELSSSWLGIGGYCEDSNCSTADSTLIQLGTEQDAFSDGSTQYYAWYEKLPAVSKLIKKFPVNPGDTITATLTCKGKCGKSQRWVLTMADLTSGQSCKKTLHYKGWKSSIEWIEEAPSLISGIQPLADFNTAVFSQSTANGVGADLSIGDSIQLFNPPYGPTSSPSAPNSTRDGFEACWGSNGTLTSCFDPFS
jgi:peptidase A4-like protein